MQELEARVKQLSVEVENGNLLRQKVTQEKAELEIHIASISAELQEANRRYLYSAADMFCKGSAALTSMFSYQKCISCRFSGRQ